MYFYKSRKSIYEYHFLHQIRKREKQEIWQCKMLFDQRLHSRIPIGAKIDRSFWNGRGRSFSKLLVGGHRYSCELTCLSVYLPVKILFIIEKSWVTHTHHITSISAFRFYKPVILINSYFESFVSFVIDIFSVFFFNVKIFII